MLSYCCQGWKVGLIQQYYNHICKLTLSCYLQVTILEHLWMPPTESSYYKRYKLKLFLAGSRQSGIHLQQPEFDEHPAKVRRSGWNSGEWRSGPDRVQQLAGTVSGSQESQHRAQLSHTLRQLSWGEFFSVFLKKILTNLGLANAKVIYANPWIPVLTHNGMRCFYVKNSA